MAALFASSPVAIADAYLDRLSMRGALPYDRSYEQLTPEQKAVVRAEYDSVGPTDEPPYPKYGLSEVADAVARMPRREAIQGDVVLTVHVDERGDAKSVSIYKTPDAKLSKSGRVDVDAKQVQAGIVRGPAVRDGLRLQVLFQSQRLTSPS
jgi:hypothetical protein